MPTHFVCATGTLEWLNASLRLQPRQAIMADFTFAALEADEILLPCDPMIAATADSNAHRTNTFTVSYAGCLL
jgi:hypothetical protein